MTDKEAVAPAKPIVRLVSIEWLNSDDLLQVAAELDGGEAEVNAYRRQAGTLDALDAESRKLTLGWTKRLREIAAEIEAYATDPAGGSDQRAWGPVLWLRNLKGGEAKLAEVMAIFCKFGIGFPSEQYGRIRGAFYESDFNDLGDLK